MKKILFALTTITSLLLPLAPRAQAASDVSLNLFYDNLSDQGSWIEVADYGYCFQPNVATGNANWRPYSDGYWAYTDVGWTWVSYEDFGWATYHYGRWSRLADYGWVWVPGYEWAPAWVSWRTGGDYIGWAPLPPSGHTVFEGSAITGQVDVEFDIGPQYYNFVDLRYIGEPVLRDRIIEPTRNVTIISSTVNVTNITYNNSTVYNYGPDYNRLNQYSTRPIQRLSLQRETTVEANLGAQGGGRNFNRVNGNQLMVVAPTIQKSQKPIAPKQVKAKVQQPKIEHGWQGISNRQQVQAEMKKENAKNVPPPTFQPQKGRKAEAAPGGQSRAASQPNETAPAGENQQADRAGRQDRNNGQRQNAGKEARQGNRNRNAGAQSGQADRRAEREAAREQKAQAAGQESASAQEDNAANGGQQQAGRAQKDQEQNARQADRVDKRAEQAPNRQQKTSDGEQKSSEEERGNAPQDEQRKVRQQKKAEQENNGKPDQARARQARRAAQAQEPQDAEQGAQREPARAAQKDDQRSQAERPERAQPEQRQERAKQKQQDDQNPDAPRKAKKKGQQEEKPDQPQP